jgi:hypothetical protein
MRLILAVAVVAVMLSWGVFAALWTSTSPNGQATIIQDALEGDSNRLDINSMNVTAGSEARFTIFFQTNIPANVPPSGSVDGENEAFGPVPWTAPNVTSSQSELEYAVFTLEFTLRSANDGGVFFNSAYWYSGPRGDVVGANFNGTFGGDYTASAIEASSPGNYTLHFLNKPTTNATVRITMGWSSVTFFNSRPYFYDGLITIGLAGAFSVTTAYFSWKRILPRKGTTVNPQNP